MIIEKNAVVSLTYTLRKNSSAGDVIEVCDVSRPLEFVCESGSMLPGFEKNVLGLKAGSSFDFVINADDAYGNVVEDAVVDVSKDIFIVDGVVREDLLVVGTIIPMRDNSGHPLNGKVVEVKNDENVVVIDFNHPLAGLDLHFAGKIESIREATADELAYGMGGQAGCGCGDGGCDSGGCESGSCDSNENSGCGSGGCGCH